MKQIPPKNSQSRLWMLLLANIHYLPSMHCARMIDQASKSDNSRKYEHKSLCFIKSKIFIPQNVSKKMNFNTKCKCQDPKERLRVLCQLYFTKH